MEPTDTQRDKHADKTPAEAKENVRQKVAKGVATVAGALQGFAEEAKKDDLPHKAQQAVQKAGETTRKTAEATRQEGRKVKRSLKGDPSPRDPLSDRSDLRRR